MKKIPIINKSRKKDVKVNIIPSDAQDDLPTPPKDYRVDEDLLKELADEFADDEPEDKEYEDLSDETYSKKNLAEHLALMEPAEMRTVVRAAKYLRKFKDVLKDLKEEEDFWKED